MLMSQSRRTLTPALLAAMTTASLAHAQTEQVVTVFNSVHMQWTDEAPLSWQEGDLRYLAEGQAVERTIDLPALPANLRDVAGVAIIVEVQPAMTSGDGGNRPGDPWTRLGSVGIVLPGPTEEIDDRPHTTLPADKDLPGRECEIIRFITGFGAPATYEQDVTSLLPILSGRATIRLFLSTWKAPGWLVTVRLRYDKDKAGARRPKLCTPLFHEREVTAEHATLHSTVVIPDGLSRPRVRIISTGHATDGTAGDEFMPRTHVLRVDGNIVSQWRPWTESGGAVREVNPWAGRRQIDGRELRSSDFDRSGWTPGLAVIPTVIPLEELTPGIHRIELEVQGIRAKDQSGLGYWFVSATVIADEPWPPTPPSQSDPGGEQR
jgi:hypothetical protein